MTHSIKFKPSGRGKAQCAPDPRYPDGVTIGPMSKRSCRIELPYPATGCGIWEVRCSECNMSMAITAAGRPDDPRIVFVPCLHPLDGPG